MYGHRMSMGERASNDETIAELNTPIQKKDPSQINDGNRVNPENDEHGNVGVGHEAAPAGSYDFLQSPAGTDQAPQQKATHVISMTSAMQVLVKC